MFVLFVMLVASPVVLMVAAQVYAMRAQSAKDNYVVLTTQGTDSAAVASEHARRFGVTVLKVWNGGYDALIVSRRLRKIIADERVHDVQQREAVESVDRWLGD
jgi:uncharacterized membrane protein